MASVFSISPYSAKPPGQAAEELAAVQARGMDLHQQLVRRRLRRRHLAQLELHAVAGGLQEIGFQVTRL
jgi:hypothetical protein